VGDGEETHPSDEDGLRGARSDVFILDSTVALGCFFCTVEMPRPTPSSLYSGYNELAKS
jgi:hypothetical protein